MTEAIQAAILDLLADGTPRRAIISHLCETFGISQATAYRRLSEAESTAPAVDSAEAGAYANLPVEVLGAMLRTLRRAEARQDDDAVLKVSAAMASAMARLRVARIPDP